jgi:hypothetical protein
MLIEMPLVRRLGLPIGSRVEMITEHNNGTWRVWLGIKNKQVEPHKYEGSYVELHPSGEAFFCNTESEEEYQVMEKRNDL